MELFSLKKEEDKNPKLIFYSALFINDCECYTYCVSNWVIACIVQGWMANKIVESQNTSMTHLHDANSWKDAKVPKYVIFTLIATFMQGAEKCLKY